MSGRIIGSHREIRASPGNRLDGACVGQVGANGVIVDRQPGASPGTDREGLQVAEAIVYLQKALEAKTVGDGLRRRIEAALDERARHYLRNTTPVQLGPSQDASWMTLECTRWRDRDEQLFALAGEVAGNTGR